MLLYACNPSSYNEENNSTEKSITSQQTKEIPASSSLQNMTESSNQIAMTDGSNIDEAIMIALKEQTKDQIDKILNYNMEGMEEYSPTLDEFETNFARFFTLEKVYTKFPFFKKFTDQYQWEIPKDNKAIHSQYSLTSSRAPFLQMKSQFLTFFGYKLEPQNIQLDRVIITLVDAENELYDLTAILRGKDERYYAFRNQSCHYIEGRGCLTYLSWKYLGRLNSDMSGRLFTADDSWANEKLEK